MPDSQSAVSSRTVGWVCSDGTIENLGDNHDSVQMVAHRYLIANRADGNVMLGAGPVEGNGHLYATTGPGGALIGIGAGLIAGGVLLAAWPGRSPRPAPAAVLVPRSSGLLFSASF